LTQIESKDDLKKRGIGSPDRAEAVMLAFADRTPNILQYVRQRVKYDQALEKAQAEGKAAPHDWIRDGIPTSSAMPTTRLREKWNGAANSSAPSAVSRSARRKR
jgi:hypothetical protein